MLLLVELHQSERDRPDGIFVARTVLRSAVAGAVGVRRHWSITLYVVFDYFSKISLLMLLILRRE